MSEPATPARRPARWDVPFSRDLADPAEQRDMSEADLDRLLATAPFSKMDPAAFPRGLPLREVLRNDTRLRQYRDGDVVVRQGDYGNSAFLVLEGEAHVVMDLPSRVVGRRERREKSWFQSLAQAFARHPIPEARDAAGATELEPAAPGGEPIFVQDVTNVLRRAPDAFDRAMAALGVGRLFGELAALGRIPRTATVLARGQTRLLEIRWQALRELRRYDPGLRRHVDDQFRKTGLHVTLGSTPLLGDLEPGALDAVAEEAEFESHGSFEWFGSYQQLRRRDADPLGSEPVIAREGEPVSGLLLIRTGFARLSRRHGHGEQTFGYLGKGGVFGLDELRESGSVPPPLRATLRAVGYVDVVRISRETFERHVRPILPPVAATPAAPADQAPDPALLEFLVERRFINGTQAMLIDLDRCTRCDACVEACAVGHEGNPRFVRHGPTFDRTMVATACMHCEDPVCMIGCPTGAIQRSPKGGEVVINDATCIGCGVCAASCPYQAIRMVEIHDRSGAQLQDPRGQPLLKATKCDLCVDQRGGPACQRACPHDALVRLDLREPGPITRWHAR